MKFTAFALVACLVLTYARAELGIFPVNQWVYVSTTAVVRLTCGPTAATVDNTGMQWWEYGSTGAALQVSDGDQLINSHPNRLRYGLDTSAQGLYDLLIIGPQLIDGTYYQCRDVFATTGQVAVRGAYLVVIDSAPVCTTTLLTTVIVEGDRHRVECIMHYNASAGLEPDMSWDGPPPYIPSRNIGNNSIYSDVSFTAERSMQSGAFTITTTWTGNGLGGVPTDDTTIPNYNNVQRSQQILINWGPKNLDYEPKQSAYNVGTAIIGSVDSLPQANVFWQALTGVMAGRSWPTISFVLNESFIGQTSLRFHAENVVNGQILYSDIFPTIIVNPIPTTPIPGPSTTTTEAPARANCNDLTGKWQAFDPDAIMCFGIDYTSNGVISGSFKNGTDPEWLYLYGRVQLNTFDQGGFTVINSHGKGVFAFVLECQACFGTEVLIASSIQNAATSVGTCGGTGVSNVIPDYYFQRVSNRVDDCL